MAPRTWKTYRIDVPANMPVKQFWALTVYDHATMSFIYTDLERTTLSSYHLDPRGRTRTAASQSMSGWKRRRAWSRTGSRPPASDPLPCMRLNGPTDALNNRSFKLPDFEPVP